MSTEMTLENLYEKLEGLGKTASKMELFMAAQNNETPEEKKARVAEEEKNMKEHEAKVAQEDKSEDEKKEAKRAARDAAIKKAMEEPDTEKRDAAIKKAEEDYKNDTKEGFGKPDEHKATDEEKEKEAQIASIIDEKKNTMIKQILSANTIINPNGLKDVQARLKTASITKVEQEWNIIKPFIAGVETTTPAKQEPVIPYFANITPTDVDANQLSASSPASEFNKISTKDLLDGNI